VSLHSTPHHVVLNSEHMSCGGSATRAAAVQVECLKRCIKENKLRIVSQTVQSENLYLKCKKGKAKGNERSAKEGERGMQADTV